MHTFRVVLVFPTMVWTLRRLGFHTLRVLFLAWLTLFPETVPFPHMSHLRAIGSLPSVSCIFRGEKYPKNRVV